MAIATMHPISINKSEDAHAMVNCPPLPVVISASRMRFSSTVSFLDFFLPFCANTLSRSVCLGETNFIRSVVIPSGVNPSRQMTAMTERRKQMR